MPTPWSYDAIAEVYATDMGQSMPFDDVGFYRDVCAQRGGKALELGCGTGRILLDLLAGGVDAIGMDRSLPMLQRLRKDAQARSLDVGVLQGDLRALPFARSARFDTILLPYSLITYLIDAQDAAALLRELDARLARNGRIVLDAFIPQPVASFSDFRRDYRRPHGTGFLEREKRITALSDGCNRIERRYRVLDRHDRTQASFDTDETIRPYAPRDLATLATTAGLQVAQSVWNYAAAATPEHARFATLLLERP